MNFENPELDATILMEIVKKVKEWKPEEKKPQMFRSLEVPNFNFLNDWSH